ncbi:VOC family protein [Tomitella biformata]|uniref:VOC family protein n=1 Tax=Tomitella biformata TaxID=630403 RepID=UPI0004B5076F|nr:hypothetical protein [Tomitella biformata]
MPERSIHAAAQLDKRDFRVLMMHRPIIHVVDLDEAADFYARVFGRPSTPLASVRKPPRPNHAIDYSTFTAVSDVLIDNLAPHKYVVDGVQRLPSVEQGHPRALGWQVEGMPGLYRELKRRGSRVTDSQGLVAAGDEAPMAGPVHHFKALPADAGLSYSFFPPLPFGPDPRRAPGWSIPPVTADDPLGIERCSHHTVLTSDIERARALVVDVLGGSVVHRGHDPARSVTGDHFHLADAVVQYATPTAGSAAAADLTANGPDDVYHAITWKVVDLERVERHLTAEGVRVQTRTDDTIITDPTSSLGVPWGFTTARIPGDPR